VASFVKSNLPTHRLLSLDRVLLAFVGEVDVVVGRASNMASTAHQCRLRESQFRPDKASPFWREQAMTRTVIFVPLVFLILSPAFADDPPQKERPGSELLSTGLVQAKDQSKRVFLLFGSPG